jgi:hypothetical protein
VLQGEFTEGSSIEVDAGTGGLTFQKLESVGA